MSRFRICIDVELSKNPTDDEWYYVLDKINEETHYAFYKGADDVSIQSCDSYKIDL